MKTISKEELAELDAFMSEFAGEEADEVEASVDLLISQLEDSFATTQALIAARSEPEDHDDLREAVVELAQRLEALAQDIADLNQRIS
ncbi:MAG: hypothetical protein VX248_09175 [Pseudomonadota bacterium]|uniref:hypothetical protein n=1 Tax=Thalassococcus sp. TaxID=1928858 RepID=UPI001B08F3F9|nr:hypothetical protein [Thalassococcus sp.]MBO6865447.1 hypothetical protein [Thalassococcus sp.]MEE3360112.1 hypothetical protein [Pseudomonadota bacterium]